MPALWGSGDNPLRLRVRQATDRGQARDTPQRSLMTRLVLKKNCWHGSPMPRCSPHLDPRTKGLRARYTSRWSTDAIQSTANINYNTIPVQTSSPIPGLKTCTPSHRMYGEVPLSTRATPLRPLKAEEAQKHAFAACRRAHGGVGRGKRKQCTR